MRNTVAAPLHILFPLDFDYFKCFADMKAIAVSNAKYYA